VLTGEAAFASAAARWAVGVTALAWFTRGLSLWRNAQLKPKSTMQSATGIAAARIEQKSMGMTGGSFNTREFFHGASARVVRNTKLLFQVFTFVVPILVLAFGLAVDRTGPWLLAFPLQFAGLLAERWFFFAQARHPQNIYYQVVS
jgi:DMSO reductase anchor subunit